MAVINSAQNIAHLPITHAVKVALSEAGYKVVDDLKDTTAEDLAKELRIPETQARNALNIINQSKAGPSTDRSRSTERFPQTQIASTPASSLLNNATNLPRFSTFCNPLDDLIAEFNSDIPSHWIRKGKQKAGYDGSISPGMVVEVAGPPGSGKTSIGVALALSARLGRWTNHDEDSDVEPGEVLIVDTEGGITGERVRDAAVAVTRNTDESAGDAIAGIHLIRIATQVQMMAFLQVMDEWLKQRPKINLVIIDTLSFHLRQPDMDRKTRFRTMELVGQQLAKASTIHRCAVVVMDQLATKYLTEDNKLATFNTGDRAVLMPQLGNIWASAKVIRLVLFRGAKGDDRRYAHASTAAGDKNVTWARYDIDSAGLPFEPPRSSKG